MSLAPEIRDLRRFAGLSETKSISRPGPIELSPPNGAPVTDDERTHGPPGPARHAVGGDDGPETIVHEPFAVAAPALSAVAGGMTD